MPGEIQRPEINRFFEARQLSPLGHKTVVDLFKQTGHRIEHVGLHLLYGADNLGQVSHVVYAHPLVLEMVIHAPFIDMAEGQETDDPVLIAEVVHFGMRCEIRHQVPV